MFVFGDPADAAKLHVDMYIDSPGPDVPDIHFEDMEEQDLRNVMAYLYVALDNGTHQGLDEAMLDVVREWFDEVFTALAEASEAFREKFMEGVITPPGGIQYRPKYLAIIKQASES